MDEKQEFIRRQRGLGGRIFVFSSPPIFPVPTPENLPFSVRDGVPVGVNSARFFDGSLLWWHIISHCTGRYVSLFSFSRFTLFLSHLNSNCSLTVCESSIWVNLFKASESYLTCNCACGPNGPRTQSVAAQSHRQFFPNSSVLSTT